MPAHALIPTAGREDFAEPFAAQLRVHLAIDDHCAVRLIEPRPKPVDIRNIADGNPLRAHRRCDGSKVIIAKESAVR